MADFRDRRKMGIGILLTLGKLVLLIRRLIVSRSSSSAACRLIRCRS
jgi:hypothetical protein